MVINFWGISLLVLAILEIILVFYFYLKYKHTQTIRYYLLFVILVIFWVLENALLTFSLTTNGLIHLSVNTINIINRFTFITGSFIATSFWLFTYTFPWPKVKLYPKYVIIAFLIPLIISIFILSTDFIVTKHYLKFGQSEGFGGTFYWIFIDEFLIFWIWGVINLFRSYKDANSFYKRIIRLLLIGVIISSTFAIITHIIIPGLTNFSSVFIEWLGAVSSVVWLVYTTRILMIKE